MQLISLGYDPEHIKEMTPAIANDIIRNQIKYTNDNNNDNTIIHPTDNNNNPNNEEDNTTRSTKADANKDNSSISVQESNNVNLPAINNNDQGVNIKQAVRDNATKDNIDIQKNNNSNNPPPSSSKSSTQPTTPPSEPTDPNANSNSTNKDETK